MGVSINQEAFWKGKKKKSKEKSWQTDIKQKAVEKSQNIRRKKWSFFFFKEKEKIINSLLRIFPKCVQEM